MKLYKPVTIVAIACALVRKRGWIDRPKDDSIPAGEGLWTSDEVRLIVTGKQKHPEWLNQKDVDDACNILNDLRTRTNLTKGDKQLAERLKEWDSLGGVPEENIGQCAVIAVYGRNGIRKRYPVKEMWKELQGSTEQGSIGERLDFGPDGLEAKLSHDPIPLKTFGSHRRILFKALGSDGNAYEWILKEGTHSPVPMLFKGDTLRILGGRVKGHPHFEGVTWTEFREDSCVLSPTCYAASHGAAIKAVS